MDDTAARDRFTKTPVVHTLPGTADVAVRRDVSFAGANGSARSLDLYAPKVAADRRLPVVVIVAAYPDPGFERMLGRRFKEMASTSCWAGLIAASGMAAIAYANVEPAADLDALLRHLVAGGEALGIDPDRIGLWASSGNGPLALAQLLRDAPVRIRAAALCYPYTLDLDGSTAVAEAAAAFRFANPAAARTIDDLRADAPLLVARAGLDETPGLNDTLDRFVSAALHRNLPLTVVNHPTGPHAFDLFHDSDTSRRVIREVLAFLRLALLPG